MKLKYEKPKRKKTKYFSLIIVPQYENTKQIKVPVWIPKLIIFSIISVFIVTGYIFWSYNKIKNSYDSRIAELNSLKSVNQKQKTEIENLKKKTSEIEEKLRLITELQETVKAMVGLDSSSNNPQTSRGGLPSRNEVMIYDEIHNIEKQMDDLSKLLEQSEKDLTSLIDDVDKKLKYLDAKPNLMPTNGRITSSFGYRKNPFGSGREFHPGIDIANKIGTKIKAAGSGIVTFAGYNGGYGRLVIISHGYGYQSVYGHNSKIMVKVGQKVKKGEVIALMGNTGRSTGPHVHFEVRLYGKPIDPKKVINNND